MFTDINNPFRPGTQKRAVVSAAIKLGAQWKPVLRDRLYAEAEAIYAAVNGGAPSTYESMGRRTRELNAKLEAATGWRFCQALDDTGKPRKGWVVLQQVKVMEAVCSNPAGS